MSDNKALDAALADIEKQFGAGSIKTLDSAGLDVESVSTGSIVLDRALGVGGLPYGRVIEIYGPESSGKSTLALHVVAEAQKQGKVCAYIDAENALDPIYAEAIGVDTGSLLISQPDTGEQGLQITRRLAQSGAVGVIVVDSVAALTPRSEIEGEIGDASVGAQARMMSQALRIIAHDLQKTGTMVIFINQLREKVGIMFGNPETTPGGRALKFYSSVRLDMRKQKATKQGDDIIGNPVKVKVVKNKVGAPFRECEFSILFGHGIDDQNTVLNEGIKTGHFSKSGAWYAYKGSNFAQGEANAADWLRENPDIYREVREAILNGEIASA